MPKAFVPSLNFGDAPTLWDFALDDNPTRIVIGPVGSGKTTLCCAEVMRRALQQDPAPKNGIRYFKAAIVRNTMPELKRTTIASWLELFSEETCGPIRMSSPVRHIIRVPAKNWNPALRADHPKQGTPGLELTVEFLALDKPKDVRELLSFEGTLIWFNEVREIPRIILDAAGPRVGRFPKENIHGVGPNWFGIIADTNPPDEYHWLRRLDLEERPPYWSIYHQPPAVVEMVPQGEATFVSKDKKYPLVVEDRRHIFGAANTLWAVNPGAENIHNLRVHAQIDPTMDPLGPGSYYGRNLGGKTRDYIECYFQGRYKFVLDGKPVVPEFDPNSQVVDDLPVLPDQPCLAGLDIGGGTFRPAAILGQRHPRGVWMFHAEVTGESMGLKTFSSAFKSAVAMTYPGREIYLAYGDPAGATRDVLFETAAFDHLKSEGINAQPAPTNEIQARIMAYREPCQRIIDGKPGLLLKRASCRMTITGLSGAWHYKKINISGTDRYKDDPEKNEYSDPCDAGGYLLSGGGEHRMMTRGNYGTTGGGSHDAVVDFDVFNS